MNQFHNGMQGESKGKWTKGVTLLDSTASLNGVLTKGEDRLTRVAALHPG